MAEEAKDPGHGRAAGGQPRADRRARRLHGRLGGRALGAAGRAHRTAPSQRLALHTALGGKYESEPVLGIVDHLGLHGILLNGVQYYVGLLATTILFIATNAGLIGISRLSWSLSEHRQLPAIFSRLHKTYRTPWFTIVFFSRLRGAADHLREHQRARQPLLVRRDAVVHDRARRDRRAADQGPRPRAPVPDARATCASAGARSRSPRWSGASARSPPGSRSSRCTRRPSSSASRGWSWAWPATSSTASAPGSACARASPSCARSARPTSTSSATARRSCRSSARDVSAQTLASAAKLIGKDGHRLRGVRARRSAPALARLDGARGRGGHGRSILESARIQGRRAGIKVRTGLIRTRSPGAALVDEARRIGADVIYLSTLHAPASEQRIGTTASYLLDKRPCRDRHRDARGAASPPQLARSERRASLRPCVVRVGPRCGRHAPPAERAMAPTAAGRWVARTCARDARAAACRDIRPAGGGKVDASGRIKCRICVAKWGRRGTVPRSEPGWMGSSRLFQPGSTPFTAHLRMAFRGSFDNNLDAKNRLTIPAKLRNLLADGVVVALQRDATRLHRGLVRRRTSTPTSSGLLDGMHPLSERLRAASSATSTPTPTRSSSTPPVA